MKRIWIIHPILFAAFPVLFLYAQNAEKMRPLEIVGPLAYCLGGAVLLTLVFSAILRNLKRATLFATLIIILFFSFGHAVQALGEITFSPFGLLYGTDDIVAVVWVALLGIIGGLIIRTRSLLEKITAIMGQMGLLLVVIQLAQGGYALASQEKIQPTSTATIAPADLPEHLPDVYYIIMDAFGREDVLREIYDVDISDFTSYLRERGFVVADESHSNYIKTIFSLAATLNFNYLDSLEGFLPKSKVRMLSAQYLRDNAVFKAFKDMGYTTVSFATTGVSYTEAVNSDVALETAGVMKEFQQILISTTPLSFILSEKKVTENPHRRLVLSTLEKLTDIYEVASPKVVFAHIMSPHSPFVFGPNGEYIQPKNQNPDARQGHDPDRYRRENCIEGYAGQVTYICKRLKEIIDDILDNYSDNKPIIVLQGDHGPRCSRIHYSFEKTSMKEIFSIMNAIYLPNGPVNSFYDRISSVNTFRLIFNEYFNTEFDLLPDKSYYCTDDYFFDFKEVPQELLSHHRGPYDDLLGQEFDSLATLDRMRLFQLGLTDRDLDDCYALGEPLMTFGGNRLEIADCRLSLESSKRHSFEAIIIPHNQLDLDLTIKIELFRPAGDNPSGSRRPRPFTHQATLPVLTMPLDIPSYVNYNIALPFEADRYRISIFRPGRRPPDYLPMDGDKRPELRVVNSDSCCPE